MGAKGQRHFGEKGQKKIKKKPDQSKGGERGRGSSCHGEEGGRRKRLDAMTVGYFRRVSERLSEGFADDEERGKRNSHVLIYRHWFSEKSFFYAIFDSRSCF